MLEIKDLHVKFHNRSREAVAGISLTIPDGEILGLVGESGSGKSVTAMSVAGLLPRRQCSYSGQILLDGTDLLHLPRALLRARQGKEIGVVFQEPMSAMDPLMKVGAQVEEALLLHAKELTAAQRREKAIQALADVELPDPEGVYNKYPHELSGGMLQRVMIAMGLSCDPKLLIADEPTTALDVTIQAQILDLMAKLKKEHNTAILMITHNMGVVAEVCDRVLVMYAGYVVEVAEVNDLFDRPSHPYTEGLLQCIPRIDEDREVLDTIKGTVPPPYAMPKGCRFAPRCPYATPECEAAKPELYPIGNGHYCRCFRYKEGADHV